jgi:muramoyltetrapeptide carboxypeptidase
MIIPERLKRGDTIGIVSPSAAISKNRLSVFNEGIEFLKGLGFKVKYGKNAFNIDDYSAGTPEEKAEDINQMFADPEVKAIICSKGGDNANSCLPLLDYEMIQRNPKIFMGMSDITVLLLSIYQKCNLITFHGSDVMGLSGTLDKYEVDEIVSRVIEGKIGIVNKNSEWKSIRGGQAEGILIGGNLRCMLKLAGTDYIPDFSNSILFLEAYKITPAQCDYQFNQLKQLGAFEKVKGVIIGYIYGLQATEEKMTQMEEVLLKVTKEYDFPIIKVNDFGHCCPNTVLPIGVEVKMNATECSLEIVEKCVL